MTANIIAGAHVDRAVGLAIGSAKRSNKLLHAAGMMCMRFAYQGEGAGLDKFAHLLNGIHHHRKSDAAKLMAWAEDFFPVSIDEPGKKWPRYRVRQSGKWCEAEWDLNGADADPFYRHKKEDTERPAFDLQSLLKVVQNAARARAAAAKAGRKIVGPEHIFANVEAELNRMAMAIHNLLYANKRRDSILESLGSGTGMTMEQLTRLQEQITHRIHLAE